MTELIATAVKSSLGLQLLQWAISKSDIWHLAHRCSELAQKINEPIDKNAYVLDSWLTMDEENIGCIGIRDLHLHQMHFDDEEDYNSAEQANRDHRNCSPRANTSLSIRHQRYVANCPGNVKTPIFSPSNGVIYRIEV